LSDHDSAPRRTEPARILCAPRVSNSAACIPVLDSRGDRRAIAARRTSKRRFFLQQLLGGAFLVYRAFLVAFDGRTLLSALAGLADRLGHAARPHRRRRARSDDRAVAPVEPRSHPSALPGSATDRHAPGCVLICRNLGDPYARPA